MLDDPAIKPKKALVVGDVDTTGMSKGEARAALKRGAKIARAAVRKQAMMEAKEKARLERMTDTQRAALAAETEAKAKAKAESMTMTDTFEEERSQRRALRQTRRNAIKSSNFVRAA